MTFLFKIRKRLERQYLQNIQSGDTNIPAPSVTNDTRRKATWTVTCSCTRESSSITVKPATKDSMQMRTIKTT